jgi:regulator of sigma E protease
MIVQRGVSYPPVSLQAADEGLMKEISFADLGLLLIGMQNGDTIDNIGNLYRLSPIEPKPLSLLPLTSSIQTKRENAILEQKKQIKEIKNPKERAAAMQMLEQDQKRVFVGGIFEDRKVLYNPSPMNMFMGVFEETWKTLKALFTGYLSPKYMAGPVGIVGAMQYGWALGVKEALFWVAVISMNLGIVNLLPIPVLDGGHICFALYEAVTKRKIKSKTMERLIFPFVVLMILFFIYLTYQDILRVISRFF